jgi:hypothetical protein
MLALILVDLRLSYFGLQNSIVKIMSFNYFIYFYKMGILAIIYKCYYNAHMEYVAL